MQFERAADVACSNHDGHQEGQRTAAGLAQIAGAHPAQNGKANQENDVVKTISGHGVLFS
jgi:hypothetical protein